jgi:signal transduction histidine kinase
LLSKVERTLFNILNHIDLTEHVKKLEAKLKNQKHFLNMVVHDLRNPAESIMHGLELVKKIITTNYTEFQDDAVKKIEQTLDDDKKHPF